jgi:succinyl-CoA synthetase beta subunit
MTNFGVMCNMKLLEYMGKELLLNCGIAVQKGVVVGFVEEISQKAKDLKSPFVLKVQILAGGRGKAGGIRFAEDIKGAEDICLELLGKEMRGCIVKKILIAEKVEVKTEWYLSIILDRLSKCPTVIFSSLGGIDIEQTAKTDPGKIVKITVNPLIGVKDYAARYIVESCGLDGRYFEELNRIVCNLYRLFNEYDCTLAEINPLAIVDDGSLMAIDCKADIDDSALYRHPDILEFRSTIDENPLTIEARKSNFLYIPLGIEGDIAVASNGSGMLMSCIDLITKNGMKACAALDLGGGATSERIAQAVKIIFKNKDTDYLFISIFGGITRCDEVAMGVKLAVEDGLKDKTVILRLEGTNKAEALEITKSIDGNVIDVKSISEGVKTLKSGRENR